MHGPLFFSFGSAAPIMSAIGITGGVSTGKSTFCDCFCEILPAARFFDADRVAHKLVDVPGIKKELVRECREKVFSDAGRIMRIQTDGRRKIQFLSVLSAESAVAVQQKRRRRARTRRIGRDSLEGVHEYKPHVFCG